MTKSYWLVFGVGGDAKPHGARFPESDEKNARKGAEALGYVVLHATTDGDLKLGEQLPLGNPYAPGTTFAPLIKQELYDRLVASTTTAEPDDQGPAASSPTNPKPELTASASSAEILAPATTTDKSRAPAPKGEGPAPASPAEAPDPWAKIGKGSTVLATAPGVEGYWPCEVIDISAKGQMLLVRWAGLEWANEPSFQTPRTRTGLLHSAAK